jgi:hypothetical protein
MSVSSKILYCRCAFAQVVPKETKDEVLEKLCDSGANFETVSDLCEMAARKDERLLSLLDGDAPIKIAACYPRAVKWLFHNAGATFPDGSNGDGCPRAEVLNMRDSSASEIVESLTGRE